jgi:hypothetical protein
MFPLPGLIDNLNATSPGEPGEGVGVDVGAGAGVGVDVGEGAGVGVSVGEEVGVDVGAGVGVSVGEGVGVTSVQASACPFIGPTKEPGCT